MMPEHLPGAGVSRFADVLTLLTLVIGSSPHTIKDEKLYPTKQSAGLVRQHRPRRVTSVIYRSSPTGDLYSQRIAQHLQ